ncbi:MAG: hypothetical protein RIF39_02930, partial [Cyclobacteriaceae bacterium]
LSILGSSSEALLQNGRLPEGLYTFCFEVLDYPTGKVLSNTSCSSVWIRLNDPPKIISPQCGLFIDPNLPLNIPFQWQLSNTISPNATLGTEFRLVVYEVTDPHASPFTAINSGKVLKILETDPQTQPFFNYSIASPALDVGKTYVYQVKAIDIGGKDLFKNNGLSEVCWFHYGYPENAKIDLIAPDENKNYRKIDRPYFRWTAPDIRIRNQPFEYEISIVELEQDQDPDQAITNNSPWYKQRTVRTFSDRGLDHLLPKVLTPSKDYVWQLTGFSGSQTVAKSEARVFHGPPLIEWFFAGRHRVVVTNSSSKDSLNFSGTGKFKVSAKDSVEVQFTNLKLKRVATYWVLEEGELRKNLPNAEPIILKPKSENNGAANFHPRALKLNRYELAIEGEVHWPLPYPIKSGEVAMVKSDRVWLNYDKYQPLGAAPLNSNNKFTLLDPHEFDLQLSTASDFLISSGIFELRAEGNFILPDKIKGKQSGRIKVKFARVEQLFYFEKLKIPFEDDIAPIKNTRIYIHPMVATVDLSETVSPENRQGDPFWKGIYFHEYEIHYGSFTDKYAQLKLSNDLNQPYSGIESIKTNAWVDGAGLNLVVGRDFDNTEIEFNTFKGNLLRLELSISKNAISSSKMLGNILLPVFSESTPYAFTIPITNEGFQPGFLEEFENETYTFNKGGGEQEINLTVRRGVFVEQRLIDMTIDLEWPALNVKSESI